MYFLQNHEVLSWWFVKTSVDLRYNSGQIIAMTGALHIGKKGVSVPHPKPGHVLGKSTWLKQ